MPKVQLVQFNACTLLVLEAILYDWPLPPSAESMCEDARCTPLRIQVLEVKVSGWPLPALYTRLKRLYDTLLNGQRRDTACPIVLEFGQVLWDGSNDDMDAETAGLLQELNDLSSSDIECAATRDSSGVLQN